jgi:hypothetical protein
MVKFLIEYRDPLTGDWEQTMVKFPDSANIPAKDWAEDYAYTLADKGEHKVTEVVGNEKS